MRRPSTLCVPLVVLLAACGVQRPIEYGQRECPSYDEVLNPQVTRYCTRCHSAAKDAGYSTQDYFSTVSRRDDGSPRVNPGDTTSLLLQAARGELANHTAVPSDRVAELEDWVVRCRAAPSHHRFHSKGWATPTDTDADGGQFHGRALRASGYDFTDVAGDGGLNCYRCHGDDLRGGKAEVDCHNCHQAAEGPAACNTCHGDATSPAPPRSLNGVRLTTDTSVGAHRAHVGDGRMHKKFGCAACHFDVQKPEDDGHYRRGGVFSSGPAVVQLDAGPSAATASWDRETAQCTNAYCHAPTKADLAANRLTPKWTGQGIKLGCDNCHGAGPTGHFYTQCDTCHGPGYSADAGTVNVDVHVNGRVDVKGQPADGGVSCDACHAGPASQTWSNLEGQTASTALTVGAHQAHLRANRFRGPLTCTDCHLVPKKITDPGHVDSAAPAEVFAQRNDAGLAWADNASPAWDRNAGTCSNVYCHGAGTRLSLDTAGYLRRSPQWTGGPSQAACSYCHGLPPQDGRPEHVGTTPITCYLCHGQTINSGGNLIFTALPDGGFSTTHIDGLVTGN